MKDQKNISWISIFGIASVWFGTHVGSGFATGAQSLSFFAQYGWTAIFMPIISMLLIAGLCYIGMTAAKYNKLQFARDYGNWVWSPYQIIGGTAVDIVTILCAILAVSACLAGCGSILYGLFGLPKIVTTVLFAILIAIVGMYGYKVVNAASGIMSIIMIICLLTIFVLGLFHNADQLSSILSNRVIFEGQSIGSAFWKMVMYTGFQASVVGTMCAVSASYHTPSDIKRTCVLGFIMNASMLTLSSLTVLSGLPGAANEIPILTICKDIGFPVLTLIYQVVLLLAFLSTGVTATFGVVRRYSTLFASMVAKTRVDADLVSPKTKLATNVVFSLICIGVAQFGLLPIINKGYSYVGVIALVVYIIPTFTAGIVKLRRDIREKQMID